MHPHVEMLRTSYSPTNITKRELIFAAWEPVDSDGRPENARRKVMNNRMLRGNVP